MCDKARMDKIKENLGKFSERKDMIVNAIFICYNKENMFDYKEVST